MKLSKNNEKKISDFFKNKPEIAAVYLYGSYAKNTARKDSDIDIAVLVRDRKSFNGFDIPQTRYLYDLSRLLKSEVEVVDLEHSPIDFAYEPYKYTAAISGLFLKKSLIFFSLFLLSFMILNYNRWKLFLQKYKTKPFF